MEKFSGRLTLIRLTNKNQLLSFESYTALEHLKAVAERYLKKGRLLKEIIEKGISKLEKKNDFDLQRLGMASLLKKVQDASNMLSLGEKLTEIVDGYLIAPALVASFQTGLESRMRVDQDYNRFVSAEIWGRNQARLSKRVRKVPRHNPLRQQQVHCREAPDSVGSEHQSHNVARF